MYWLHQGQYTKAFQRLQVIHRRDKKKNVWKSYAYFATLLLVYKIPHIPSYIMRSYINKAVLQKCVLLCNQNHVNFQQNSSRNISKFSPTIWKRFCRYTYNGYMVENRSTVQHSFQYNGLANKFGYIFRGMKIKFSCNDERVFSVKCIVSINLWGI